MIARILFRALLALLLFAGGSLTAYLTRDLWLPGGEDAKTADPPHEHGSSERVKPTPQAIANLGIVARPLTLQSFKRTIEIPGAVVDRPGHSDRGVSATIAGIVTQIHVQPGIAVKPGDVMFTLRLTSEYVQNAQAELFKTSSEMVLNRKQRERLGQGGVTPEAKLLDLDNQYTRLEVIARAHVQDLQSRGLSPEQVADIKTGHLITEVKVFAPRPVPVQSSSPADVSFLFEVQEIKAELGQQVQAGHLLALLANHQQLVIEGRALAQEAGLIEKAARADWPVEVEIIGDEGRPWSGKTQEFRIRYIANMLDPARRVVLFHLPLSNEGDSLVRDGRTFFLWRYRPGQRVKLHIPVEEWKDVFVLPAPAVVREGAEAYVFRQNGDAFDRKSVHLLHFDQRYAVLNPEKSDVAIGQWIAPAGAAALNRMLKAQAGGGEDAHGHNHHHHH
jgi:multidrug efflux pump subunit AcrA (membrane-fusion protein)